MNVLDTFEREYEHLKLCAAREAQRLESEGTKPEKYKNWAAWWSDKFGDDFNEYMKNQRKTE